jgi:hypothetical protein
MRESLRAAAPGAAGREVPMPVPKKSEQPSEDIRQQKPLVRLQQKVASGHEAGVKGRKWGQRRFAARQGSEESREGGPGSGRKPGGGKVKSPLGKAPDLGGQGPAKKPQAGPSGGNVSYDPRRETMAHLRSQGYNATGSSGGMMWHSKDGKPGAILVDTNGGWDHVQKQGDGPFKRIAAGPDVNSLKDHMKSHGLSEGGPGSGRKPGGGGASAQDVGAKHQKIIDQQNEKMPGPIRDVMNPHDPRTTGGSDTGGGKYESKEDRMGNFTITRKSDGASAYLQGDDANQHRADLEKLDKIKYPSGPFKNYEQHHDAIASQYDDVMQPKAHEAQRWPRRSLRRPIWESDDSERDRSDSGLTA